MSSYSEFLSRKVLPVAKTGIEPGDMPTFMKPHQADATAFTLRTGRAGNFLDTGMGKTVCELEFSRQAAEASNGKALIGTPLAVAKQIEREARKFGYDARVIRDQSEARDGINICNYDRFDKLDPAAFGAVILDESSILKDFSGATSRGLRDAFRGHRFRLSASATPAPNDHMELGQHAEFLGVMNSVEMLSKFFINDTSTASQQWRLKGHAEQAFWDWMASWACMAETPADFGHDASEYFLPPLEIIKHQTGARTDLPKDGLFAADANATNIHEIKRATTSERVKLAARVILDGTWAGNASTLTHVEHDTKPAKPSESGAAHNPAHLNKTKNTCASTISGTKNNSKNTSGPIRIRETLHAESDMHPTQITGKSAGAFPRKETNLPNETADSNHNLASQPSNTTTCLPSNPEAVPFVAQSAPTGEGEISPSIIAMSPTGSEDCFAPTATKELANSRTMLAYCGRQQITSSDLDWWVVWCDTNYEQEALEKVFGSLCFSVYGSLSSDEKEERYIRWESGERKILVSKPSIFGHGMNMQHCCNMLFLGRSFSYETWYQAVRRCWRFGQRRPVHVHLAIAEGEDQIGRVIDRKSADHVRMKRMMSTAMRRALGREVQTKVAYNPTHYAEIPQWLMAS